MNDSRWASPAAARRIRASLAASLIAIVSSCASSGEKGADAVTMPSAAIRVEAINSAVEPVGSPGRVLVVYYSRGEAAKSVAEDLAALTGADIERIVEKKARGSGFFGFMGAGAAATFKLHSKIVEPELDPSAYDAVYVCAPVWSWSLTPPVRAWLRRFRGSIRKAAFITVSGDTEPDKIAKSMAKEVGVEPFTVAGFAERDFKPDGRDAYLRKISGLVAPLR